MTSSRRPQEFGQSGHGADVAPIRADSADATRYLCAAAYLDEDFARQVVDEAFHEPHRAVAPSYGVDLVPILRHCLESRRRVLVRDVVVTAALAVVVVLAITKEATLLLGIAGVWLVTEGAQMLRKRAANTGLVVLGAGGFLLFRAVDGVLAAARSGSGEGAPGPEGSGADRWVLAAVTLGAIWGAYVWYRVSVHQTIVGSLTRGVFDGGRAPSVSAAHGRRLAYVDQAQRGNVTVYSPDGVDRPFLGAGVVMTEWNLVTPLRPARVDLTEGQQLGDGRPAGGVSASASASMSASTSAPSPAEFDVRVLYERVREGVVALGHPSLPAQERLGPLTVSDQVFVAGSLPADSAFLDGERRPVFAVGPEVVDAVGRAERGQVRHYQSVRMAVWQGDLEVTTFLYAAVRGGMLYVEFVATKLPGIRPAFRAIDGYERFGAGSAVLAGARAVVDLVTCPRAVLNVATHAVEVLGRVLAGSSADRENRRRSGFDYGARSSVRELGTHFPGSVRFQDYDADERVTLVERRVLEVVVGTLREHGFDVGELTAQAAAIINKGAVAASTVGPAGARTTTPGRHAAAPRP